MIFFGGRRAVSVQPPLWGSRLSVVPARASLLGPALHPGKSGRMVERMAEIVWSDAASGRSPKASWHMRYVTPASTTWFLSDSRTVEGDPTRQKPSSRACSNEFGRFGGIGKLRVLDRKVNVLNQPA